jgi:hypothetical protein
VHSSALAAPGCEFLSTKHVAHVSTLVAFCAVEYVPSGHDRHSPVPSVALYVPRAHRAHCPPALVFCVICGSALKKPASQLQKRLRYSECECSGHIMQGAEPETAL